MALTPAQLADIRQRVLDDPFYLARLLGLEVQWFHRRWATFCLENPKHVLEAPRGFGKSTICTTVLVIWRLLRDFDTRILIVSKTETQASRFLQEIRAHLETNAVLKAAFGSFVGTGKWTDTALVVAQRKKAHKEATVSAMGLEGPIVGGHWDWIFVDDPFDEESSRSELLRDRAYEWLFTTLQPTLIPGGSIGIRCTRYHWHDLAGKIEREQSVDQSTGEMHVYRLEAEGDPLPLRATTARWRVLQTPAILRDGSSLWESRFPLEDRVEPDGRVTEGLRSMRRGREKAFTQQFLLLCVEEKAGEQETEFKRAWFRVWQLPPAVRKLEVFMRVDPAFRDREQAAQRTKRDHDPDYYAIGVVGFDRAAGKAYVLDAFRDRLTPLEREQAAQKVAKRWQPRLIEVERTGLQIKEAPEFYHSILTALAPHPARFGNPGREGNKVARAQPIARAMERGDVLWCPELLERYPVVDEFTSFPYGDHDDLVDAISGAYLIGDRRSTNLTRFRRQEVAAEGGGGAMPQVGTARHGRALAGFAGGGFGRGLR